MGVTCAACTGPFITPKKTARRAKVFKIEQIAGYIYKCGANGVIVPKRGAK